MATYLPLFNDRCFIHHRKSHLSECGISIRVMLFSSFFLIFNLIILCILLTLPGILNHSVDSLMVQEIFSSSTHKTKHFQKIHRRTGVPFNSMLFFDDEDRNIEAVRVPSVLLFFPFPQKNFFFLFLAHEAS